MHNVKSLDDVKSALDDKSTINVLRALLITLDDDNNYSEVLRSSYNSPSSPSITKSTKTDSNRFFDHPVALRSVLPVTPRNITHTNRQTHTHTL